jgi:hypothetical protein
MYTVLFTKDGDHQGATVAVGWENANSFKKSLYFDKFVKQSNIAIKTVESKLDLF